ncbi:MAG: hypothetical protein IPL65_13735 [Lewinellaceae bacterium]|nr:hypothetical protein [Lewinellaceae bacterium]
MVATMYPALATNNAFHPDSRVWVYTAERSLSDAEAMAVQQHLDIFTKQWTAHNQQLKAGGELFANRYLILMVDETQAGASGCSIDKSVHFVESLGAELGIDFFNRMLFGSLENNQIEVRDINTFREQLRAGELANDALVVNTLCQTRQELEEKWLLPYSQSWMPRII